MNNSKPATFYKGPMTLSRFMDENRLRTRKAKDPAVKPAWAAWQGRLSEVEHYDLHGPGQFEYADTEAQAIKKLAARLGITIPSEVQ